MCSFIKRSLPQISAAGRIQYSEGNRNLWNTLWKTGMLFVSYLPAQDTLKSNNILVMSRKEQKHPKSCKYYEVNLA